MDESADLVGSIRLPANRRSRAHRPDKRECESMIIRSSHGYVAATVGALIGPVILGPIAGIATAWLTLPLFESDEPCPDMFCLDGLEALVLGVFAFIAGVLLGLGLGCWIALRVRGHVRALRTVGALYGLLCLLSVCLALLSVVQAIVFVHLMTEAASQSVALVLTLALIVCWCLSVPSLARYLALRDMLPRQPESTEDSPREISF